MSDIIIAVVSKDKQETLQLLLYQNIRRLYFQMRSVVRRAPAFCIRRAVSELIPFYLNYKVGQCSHTFFHLGTPKIIFTCQGSTSQRKLKQNRGGARRLLKYCQLPDTTHVIFWGIFGIFELFQNFSLFVISLWAPGWKTRNRLYLCCMRGVGLTHLLSGADSFLRS